jgi:hypothetical protein
MTHRYDVVFHCGDGMGVLPIQASDQETAWAVARRQLPGCRLALVSREEGDDQGGPLTIRDRL